MKLASILLLVAACVAAAVAVVQLSKDSDTSMTGTALFEEVMSEVEQAADDYLQSWADQNQFSGVVLLAGDGYVVFYRAYGKADYEANVPNTVDTEYRIGSLTKAFTAMAVLQLEQQGLLSSKSPLSTYLPDYPRGKEITLEMLLNHRSGIVDHTTLPDFQTMRRVEECSLERTIETFRNRPLEFAPGAKFKYSSSGYILLGHIIEQVTRKPYAEVIQTGILDPLALTRTGFEYHEQKPQGMALGYKLENNEIQRANDRVMQNAHASGALYSTVGDLYEWDQALYTDRLVKQAALDKALDPDHDPYSYGWGMTRVLGKRVLAHSGETEGFLTCIMRFVDDNACVIVLSNFEHCPMNRIVPDLVNILFEKPYELSMEAVTSRGAISNYDEYVGCYKASPALALDVTREGEQLFCQGTGQRRVRLHPESPTEFVVQEADARVRFIRHPMGRVVGLVLHQSGKQVPAARI